MNKFLVRLWAVVMVLALVMGIAGVSVASAENDDNKGRGNEIRAIVKDMVKDIKESVKVKVAKHKEVGSTLEVHIFDGGKVLVRGAQVTAINNGIITAQNSWASTTMNWTVNTNTDTNFIHRFGGNGSIADIAVGHIISFDGTIVSGTGLTVQAKTIKDWSTQKPEPVRSTVQGTLKSIASSTVPTTFVLTVGSTDFTVNVSATTSILNNAWLATSLSNFQVGHTVRVYGAINTASSTINATVVRNTSI